MKIYYLILALTLTACTNTNPNQEKVLSQKQDENTSAHQSAAIQEQVIGHWSVIPMDLRSSDYDVKNKKPDLIVERGNGTLLISVPDYETGEIYIDPVQGIPQYAYKMRGNKLCLYSQFEIDGKKTVSDITYDYMYINEEGNLVYSYLTDRFKTLMNETQEEIDSQNENQRNSILIYKRIK